MAAIGIELDSDGMDKLMNMIEEYKGQENNPNPEIVFQFIFNEGSKAGAQQILRDFYKK